jgi:RNA polymerase sigma factor for flagellar operon FliA
MGAGALADPRASGADDEASLWQRWCFGADDSARQLLVERYIPYARAIAAKLYARRAHDEFRFDEYQQFAMVGLIESVERYRPDRGAHFKTFAMHRVRGAILNGLERLSERQQQSAFRRRLATERAVSLTPENLSREPTQQLLEQLQDIGVGVALGLILEGTGVFFGVSDELPADAYAQLEMRQLRQQLWEMVERLTGREREIIDMHYREARSFQEIAEALKLSKGRISQLHRQAVERLRALISKAGKCDVAY